MAFFLSFPSHPDCVRSISEPVAVEGDDEALVFALAFHDEDSVGQRRRLEGQAGAGVQHGSRFGHAAANGSPLAAGEEEEASSAVAGRKEAGAVKIVHLPRRTSLDLILF